MCFLNLFYPYSPRGEGLKTRCKTKTFEAGEGTADLTKPNPNLHMLDERMRQCYFLFGVGDFLLNNVTGRKGGIELEFILLI